MDRNNLYRDIFNGTNKKHWKEEQKNKKMKKFETWILKYGHWSFLFSSLFEAYGGSWLIAAALMFLFINYQYLRK
jgi:hypothetical protein